MIFFYGYALLFLVAGIFSYELNGIQLFVIAGITYLFDTLAFKNIKRTLLLLVTVIFVITSAIITMVRLDFWDIFLKEILDFLKVYYLSVTVDTVVVGELHQWIIVAIIGLLLMQLLKYMIPIKGHHYTINTLVTCGIILLAFWLRTLGSIQDRYGFVVMISAMIVYFFYNFYHINTHRIRSFFPFVVTSFIVIIVIVGAARGLYSLQPRPFQVEKKSGGTFQLSDEVNNEYTEVNKLSYYRKEAFIVENKFIYENINVLKIRTGYTKYLKSDTYELYYNGQWHHMPDLEYLENDGDYIELSGKYDPVDYELYYHLDPSRVVLQNINTNILLVNNYRQSRTDFFQNIRVMHDPRRGSYFTNDVLSPGYAYSFVGVVPNYGSDALVELIKSNSHRLIPDALTRMRIVDQSQIAIEAGYDIPVTELPLVIDYDKIHELALEITEEYDNNYDKAKALETYLRMNYTYNLDPYTTFYEENNTLNIEGIDPAYAFLFITKQGFCQHFATSFSLLARSINLPVRYATGFYVEHTDLSDHAPVGMGPIENYEDVGYFNVTDENAHTWPEIYFPEVGWIMFEPTPAMTYEFDQVPMEDYELPDLNAEVGDGSPFIEINYRTIIIFFAIIAMLLIMYILYRYIHYRIKLKKRTYNEKIYMLYRLMDMYLSLIGLKRLTGESRREFAARIDRHFFEDTDGQLDLISIYESMSYGDALMTVLEYEAIMKYYAAFKHRIKRRVTKPVYYLYRIYEYFVNK